ncbi:hypothetical protein Y59_06430 [Enterobacter hormaechei]|nr:hypothetical protein HMPREF1591_01328 [Escherichia coli 113303]KAF0681172.1 hypothetical protein Y59_06430 [Enterobacter hormaechei]
MRINLPAFTFQERQNSSAPVMIFPSLLSPAQKTLPPAMQ